MKNNWLVRDILTGLNPLITFIRGQIGLQNQYMFGCGIDFSFTEGFVYNYGKSKLYLLTYSDTVSVKTNLKSVIRKIIANDKFTLKGNNLQSTPFCFEVKKGNQFEMQSRENWIIIIQFTERIRFSKFINSIKNN